jgi:hypothetical protein
VFFLSWENFREKFLLTQKFLRTFLLSPKFSRKIFVYAKVFAKFFSKTKILRKFSFKGKFFAKSYQENWLFVLKHYPNSTIQLGTSTLKRLSHLLWNRTRIFSPNYQIILHSFPHLILSITRILLVHCIPSTSKLRMPLGIRMFHGIFAYLVKFSQKLSQKQKCSRKLSLFS